MEAVCRAITFINYHIPLTEGEGVKPQYCTVGFFDGMFTERLTVGYNENDLKSLWRYSVNKTAESQGKFSYQNIYGFSEDSWNRCTDEEFWKNESDAEFPLLFVVFLQLSDYMTDEWSIKLQCEAFNNVLYENLGENAKFYVYGTIDKNDFVVCIRNREHVEAVNAIKKLHSTKSSVVYSYSVLSVSNKVLETIDESRYPDFFEQFVDSICLKGITNSFNPDRNITLDQRYYEFCNKLIERLYPKEEKEKPEEEREYRIYDIMGDDDFRLIARKVNLGMLLKEFGEKGLLGNYQGDLRFYLYSSSLVLNTITERQSAIEPWLKTKTVLQMNEVMKSPLCDQLEHQMFRIRQMLNDNEIDEKKVTFCQALWQLLQSLKVLESAPAKKYDFYSLYHPFATFVSILERKMSTDDLIDSGEIFEFIHKISMTLHGTLRTDIRFFQIRDFNVIVHYAPAKLRAFYAIWALKLSEFYNSFERTDKKYSFILSPGVFGETHVKQLFVKYDERERLMLITTPERNLYIPRWLSLIIAHEVSHFVGTKIRERMFRHKILLRLSVHIAALEMQHFWYEGMPDDLLTATKEWMKLPYLRNQLKKELVRADKEIYESQADICSYHSGRSKTAICQEYRYVSDNDIAKRIIYEYGGMLQSYLCKKVEESGAKGALERALNVLDSCREREEKVLLFFARFQQAALPAVLTILHYICTETFADIIAILTLGISPVEYVMSFEKSDYLGENRNREQESTVLLPVRIAVTMKALKTIIHKNKDWLDNYASEWAEKWMGNVIRDSIYTLKNGSVAQNIMVQVYGYTTYLTVKKNHIDTYLSMYNPAYNDETFSIKKLDFLNDVNVFKLLCEYMNKCADTYFAKLKEDEKLRRMREGLLLTYQQLSGGSVPAMMQEIEKFLYEYEKSYSE